MLDTDVIGRVRQTVLRVGGDLGLLAHEDASLPRSHSPLEGTGYDDPRWLDLQRQLGLEPAVQALAEHPALVGLMSTLYGVPAIARRGDICRLGMPGAPTLTTPPHQDHFYVGGTPDLWTAWTPLTACPLSLGPLAVWEGSHHAGVRPHTGEGAGRQAVSVAPNTRWASESLVVGDVVLFHSMTVHRALPNTTTDTVRLSMDMRYQPADQPLDNRRVDGTRPY